MGLPIGYRSKKEKCTLKACGINAGLLRKKHACSVLYVPSSAFRLPPSAFRLPPSAFRIPHSAFRIPHSAFRGLCRGAGKTGRAPNAFSFLLSRDKGEAEPVEVVPGVRAADVPER